MHVQYICVSARNTVKLSKMYFAPLFYGASERQV